MTSKTIAQTIKDQLLAGGIHKVLCWGITGFIAYNDNGLCFKVDGLKFQGIVVIEYMRGTDTYTVYFTKQKLAVDKETRRSHIIHAPDDLPTITGVYCDQLTEIIDDKIERISAYKY